MIVRALTDDGQSPSATISIQPFTNSPCEKGLEASAIHFEIL